MSPAMPTERDSTQESSAGAGKPDWAAVESNVIEVEIVKDFPPLKPADNSPPMQGSHSAPQRSDQPASREAPRSHPTGSTRAGIATYHEDAIHASLRHGIKDNTFDFNNEDVQSLVDLFARRHKCMVRHNDAWTAVEFIGPHHAVMAAYKHASDRVKSCTDDDDLCAIQGRRIYFFQDSNSSWMRRNTHQVMVSLLRFYSKDPNAENDFSRDPIDNHEWEEFNA